MFELAGVLAKTFTPRRDAFAVTLDEVVRSPDAHLLVAVLEGRVVGYLLGFRHRAFFANGVVAWIEEIAVGEDVRRRGLGSLLVAEFEERQRRADVRLVALATTRAGPFYAALGYADHATYHRKVL